MCRFEMMFIMTCMVLKPYFKQLISGNLNSSVVEEISSKTRSFAVGNILYTYRFCDIVIWTVLRSLSYNNGFKRSHRK